MSDNESDSEPSSPNTPFVDQVLSSWNGQKANTEPAIDGSERIKLSYDQTLTSVGHYELKVISGVVSMYGAYLTTKSITRRVLASSTESLPVIRCVSGDWAEIQLSSVNDTSVSPDLSAVSPLFQGVWKCKCEHCVVNISASYIKLRHSSEHHLAKVSSLGTSVDWQQYLHTNAQRSSSTNGAFSIVVTGQNPLEISTFSRLLTNSLLTLGKSKSQSQVLFLDLDPERSENGWPGHISLSKIQQPVLQPNWTHDAQANDTILRAHPIGVKSNGRSKARYLAGVQDLVRLANKIRIANRRDPIQLLIHCPASAQIFGNGLIKNILEIVTDAEVVNISKTQLSTIPPTHKVTQLPPLPENIALFSSRSVSQQRDMQLQSYFHTTCRPKSSPCPSPITSWRPYVVSYSEGRCDFAGFHFTPEIPHMYPGMLSNLLNGTLVSIVVADDNMSFAEHEILRGEKDDLPYFAPSNDPIIDATMCSSIGIALIRSIDVERKLLLILAPPDMSKIASERIVLVAGLFDVPSWAYREDYHFRKHVAQTGDAEARKHFADTSSGVPWLECSDIV
ncbi:hypothetical protein BT63DRAFT_105221 [Microthyrium microscopicum]|uniref:Polynucleotide 5'-hydroxyl-kinase GRC3 n=1 Tax=Microthyrium microscopicum TaxID=703497 RepID=A0A6A6TVY9_9PEZI|nr:hypothetical protein BT63DRAFT_105221 [Microthyrium microscopicum]